MTFAPSLFTQSDQSLRSVLSVHVSFCHANNEERSECADDQSNICCHLIQRCYFGDAAAHLRNHQTKYMQEK